MTVDPNNLAEVPLFTSLSEEDRRELAGWFESRIVGPGTKLCGEGAAGYTFFVLTEGAADVNVGGEVVRSLGPGDFFGEVGVLEGGRRTATVTTTSGAKVLALFGTEFRRLQEKLPETAASIEAAMRERLVTPGYS